MPALSLAFVLGGLSGWWIHATMSTHRPSETLVVPSPSIAPSASSSSAPGSLQPEPTRPAAIPASGDVEFDPITELRRRALRLPLDGVNAAMMQGGFAALRRGEPRGHEAVDLPAPRNTPVRAVEDGKIAKLFFSKAGGNTVYQFDPSERFCYYYAHLDHYADGLHDDQLITKGEVIGYVGTTGNAPADTPHLHFAILRLGEDKRWWHGTAIDPYLVFRP